MKTIKLTVAHSSLGVGSYRSPEVSVTEVINEGVLCASAQGVSIEEWTEDKLNW